MSISSIVMLGFGGTSIADVVTMGYTIAVVEQTDPSESCKMGGRKKRVQLGIRLKQAAIFERQVAARLNFNNADVALNEPNITGEL